MNKQRYLKIFIVFILIFTAKSVSAVLKIDGIYEMELKCNLQKDKEVDIMNIVN